MTKNKMLEKNTAEPSFILYAPKIKFKKPIISPTPFSLNDSFSDNDNGAFECNDTNDKYSDDSFEEENYLECIKTNVTSFTLKIHKSSKQ